MRAQPDHFKWKCANVLIGVGDPFSTSAAEAFELAAIEKGIDVCAKVKYVAGSSDMTASIRQIVKEGCCQATVVFAQVQDLVSLFQEANTQRYVGQWIVGDNIVGSLADVVKDLKRHLPEPAVHNLLRGTYDPIFSLAGPLRCICGSTVRQVGALASHYSAIRHPFWIAFVHSYLVRSYVVGMFFPQRSPIPLIIYTHASYYLQECSL